MPLVGSCWAAVLSPATTIASGTTTVYVRKTFNVSNVQAIKQLVLDLDFDDGFVAYLNGVEIARSGLTSNPVNWDELAADHEAQVYQGLNLISFVLNEAALQNVLQLGTNVLALEVHNSSTTSSDLSLIPYLTFGFDDASFGGIRLNVLNSCYACDFFLKFGCVNRHFGI